jgi:LacI family transcriptional regulator
MFCIVPNIWARELSLKSPTVFDVAERAGVSKSTVSLVNQDSPLVSPDTRLRVEAAAKELGYVYNRAAATLRKPKSATIGLVIPNLRNNFFAEAVIGVEDFFSKGSTTGSKTLFLSHHLEDQEKLIDAVRSMLESRVDGLIIVPALQSSSKFFQENQPSKHPTSGQTTLLLAS